MGRLYFSLWRKRQGLVDCCASGRSLGLMPEVGGCGSLECFIMKYPSGEAEKVQMWPHLPRTSRGGQRYITIFTNKCNSDCVRNTDSNPGDDGRNLKAVTFPFTVFTSAVTVGQRRNSLVSRVKLLSGFYVRHTG